MRTSRGDVATVRLATYGNALVARDRVRTLLQRADGTATVVFDASGLLFLSRTAAAELADAARRWEASGRTVRWRSCTRDVRKMLEVVGVHW